MVILTLIASPMEVQGAELHYVAPASQPTLPSQASSGFDVTFSPASMAVPSPTSDGNNMASPENPPRTSTPNASAPDVQNSVFTESSAGNESSATSVPTFGFSVASSSASSATNATQSTNAAVSTPSPAGRFSGALVDSAIYYWLACNVPARVIRLAAAQAPYGFALLDLGYMDDYL
ncbi:hypothetical protein OBBRIDRAFT_253184 [Obba rivulosa]|uniref:Uncharacterized protein n=1 Tax=Obba rivulosa TaxID=1052685 RepID=A0A8E2J5N9_9APHY|nr:hypothetical protein OBBRIDRAFT_253184 [Obba rivulosa]